MKDSFWLADKHLNSSMFYKGTSTGISVLLKERLMVLKVASESSTMLYVIVEELYKVSTYFWHDFNRLKP